MNLGNFFWIKYRIVSKKEIFSDEFVFAKERNIAEMLS